MLKGLTSPVKGSIFVLRLAKSGDLWSPGRLTGERSREAWHMVGLTLPSREGITADRNRFGAAKFLGTQDLK